MSKSRTLPSKQRTNVLRAYRSRGRANRNLWLVYSPKTDRDWILGSDRHLVHWIFFLETNPDVRSFEIEPSNETPRIGESQPVLDADAAVVLANGTREYHKLSSLTSAQSDGMTCGGDESSLPTVRVFTESDLQPRSEEALR
jgi:hypothetical protein